MRIWNFTRYSQTNTMSSLDNRATMRCSVTLLILFSWVALLSGLWQGGGLPRLARERAPLLMQEKSQRALLLAAVKSSILNSMGMEKEPSPVERASEEELRSMWRLYRETVRQLSGNASQEGGSWQRTSRASTVLLPATVKRLKVLQSDKEHPSNVLWFRALFHKNPNIKKQLLSTRAELKLYRQALYNSETAKRTIWKEVHTTIYEAKSLNSSRLIPKESVVQEFSAGTGDLTVDIRTEVDMWRGTSDTHSLVVDVGLVVEEGTDPSGIPQVVLEIDLVEPRSAGRKRQTRSDREDNCDKDGHCCRKSANVSFKEIGWSEWVVAPTSYNMHFCDGSCPHNYKPASMHAQVKSRLHHLNQGAMPRPCCVPAAFEPMVLMHYDSRGKLKLTPFDDLIVSKCLCA
ncbi:univin [Esox lucius]|uniref:TGF-beta family profile domain-containing protein n=1 Tax=Esox lucius TaxID=8010 RepID=A0A6Q2Z144_ESOLU|nr:univin [Esox lucius]